MKLKIEELNTVLVTDCGSTTTKALLFQRRADGWRQTARGEAPTTVEAPVADVTVGAVNAFREIQEVTGRQILAEESSTEPLALNKTHPFELTQADKPQDGIDLYLSTSSAGGGLQMLVGGIAQEYSAASAFRAASGAGAIVLDTIRFDDGRTDIERIQRIRSLRPDIFLLAGGTTGGSKSHAAELAEIILAANPTPRFGATLKLPLIFAGNPEAEHAVRNILSSIAEVSHVENVRPGLDNEQLLAAREMVHEIFLSHVMSHSPGYDKLMSWSPRAILPTPSAVGLMVQAFARQGSRSVLCADIGGATTDVFSVFFPRGDDQAVYNRTVSANYGMSYSIAHVLLEAGVEQIRRWLPYHISLGEVRDRLRNKMIRPTSIPENEEDLWLEQAVCREALRLSLEHHRQLASNPLAQNRRKGIAEIFNQSSKEELVDVVKLDTVIGSGGVLSHAPQRMQAALMMLEGFGLAGITNLAVDSVFMMPHLGVFSELYPQAASEIFEHDCIVRIATSIVPFWNPKRCKAENLAEVFIQGKSIGIIKRGTCVALKPEYRGAVTLRVNPLHAAIDLGAGAGESVEKKIILEEGGLLCDGRNRPIELPQDDKECAASMLQIYKNLGIVH